MESNEMVSSFLKAARTGFTNNENQRAGKKRILSQLFLEIQEIDPECAKVTMNSWARFFEAGSSRQDETRFRTLEEYLPYRIIPVGNM
jgi:hypothetical protein